MKICKLSSINGFPTVSLKALKQIAHGIRQAADSKNLHIGSDDFILTSIKFVQKLKRIEKKNYDAEISEPNSLGFIEFLSVVISSLGAAFVPKSTKSSKVYFYIEIGLKCLEDILDKEEPEFFILKEKITEVDSPDFQNLLAISLDKLKLDNFVRKIFLIFRKNFI